MSERDSLFLFGKNEAVAQPTFSCDTAMVREGCRTADRKAVRALSGWNPVMPALPNDRETGTTLRFRGCRV